MARERTTKEQIDLMRQAPYGKTTQQLKELAIAHWMRYLPKYFKGLQRLNRLQTTAASAAEKTQAEIKELMAIGGQQ